MPSGKYPEISIAVDLAVFTVVNGRAKLLLVKRGGEPYRGAWALPGGFLEASETLDEAANRELREETGVEVRRIARGPLFDSVDRDPRGRVISVPYAAVAAVDEESVVAADDAAEARLFALNELPSVLAFDHAQIIATLRTVLREHLDRSSEEALPDADLVLLKSVV